MRTLSLPSTALMIKQRIQSRIRTATSSRSICLLFGFFFELFFGYAQSRTAGSASVRYEYASNAIPLPRARRAEAGANSHGSGVSSVAEIGVYTHNAKNAIIRHLYGETVSWSLAIASTAQFAIGRGSTPLGDTIFFAQA